MQIRHYAIGEEPTLWQLLYDTVHHINIRDYTQAQVDAWAPAETDLAAWMDRLKLSHPWVAVEAGEVVGFAELYPEGRIGCLYVQHARQGTGVGSALFDRLLQEAEALGLSRLEVDASITARDFFQRKGFVLVREQQVERRGERLTSYLMTKSIG